MTDWNVIVSLHERSFKKAFRELQKFGFVDKSDFFNVLVMKVTDIDRFLQTFGEWVQEHPDLLRCLAKIVPVTDTFSFNSREEFEQKASQVILKWVPKLAQRSFYVRVHRRGFKGKISSSEEEHFLADFILNELSLSKHTSQITFDDPDAIIVVETLGQWAGLAYYERDILQTYPWININ